MSLPHRKHRAAHQFSNIRMPVVTGNSKVADKLYRMRAETLTHFTAAKERSDKALKSFRRQALPHAHIPTQNPMHLALRMQ